MKIVDKVRSYIAPKKIKENNLEKLPSEILNQIFMHLGPRGTQQLSYTSKTLKALEAKSDYSWKLKFQGGTQPFKVYGEDIFYTLNVNTASEDLKGIHLKRLLKMQIKELPYEIHSMQLEYNTLVISDTSDVKLFRIENKNYIYIKHFA